MEHTRSCGPIDDDIDAFAVTQCKQGSMVARPTRSGALKESPGALGSIAVNHLSRPAMWHSLRWHSLQCSTTCNGRICNVGPPRGYLARPEGAEDAGAPGQLSLAVETGSLAFIASAADCLREPPVPLRCRSRVGSALRGPPKKDGSAPRGSAQERMMGPP